MKSLLEIVTKCIDRFSEENHLTRLAAIIGGEAVILHGIPRTTLDLDILYFSEEIVGAHATPVGELAHFMRKELGSQFQVEKFDASKDPFDPLRHDIIIITDAKRRFKKLDILIANFKWEVEGLQTMGSPSEGPLQPFPKPYLAAMKLMAGGAQDEEDVRNLFLIMDPSEKEKAWELARLIKRDRNLSRILARRRQ